MKKTPKCKNYCSQRNDVLNPFTPHLHKNSKMKWKFETILTQAYKEQHIVDFKSIIIMENITNNKLTVGCLSHSSYFNFYNLESENEIGQWV